MAELAVGWKADEARATEWAMGDWAMIHRTSTNNPRSNFYIVNTANCIGNPAMHHNSPRTCLSTWERRNCTERRSLSNNSRTFRTGRCTGKAKSGCRLRCTHSKRKTTQNSSF